MVAKALEVLEGYARLVGEEVGNDAVRAACAQVHATARC